MAHKGEKKKKKCLLCFYRLWFMAGTIFVWNQSAYSSHRKCPKNLKFNEIQLITWAHDGGYLRFHCKLQRKQKLSQHIVHAGCEA